MVGVTGSLWRRKHTRSGATGGYGHKSDDPDYTDQYEFRWFIDGRCMFEATLWVCDGTNGAEPHIYIWRLYNMNTYSSVARTKSTPQSRILTKGIGSKTLSILLYRIMSDIPTIRMDTTIFLDACGEKWTGEGKGPVAAEGLLRRYRSMGFSSIRRKKKNDMVRMVGTVRSVLDRCPKRWSHRNYKIPSDTNSCSS